MDLPATLPLKVLCCTHPDYNPLVMTPSGRAVPVLSRNGDLYESDDRFARRKGLYLRSRKADSSPDYYAARLACARSPELGTTQINRLAGACFVGEPKLEVPAGAAEYWKNLNTDADGTGRDLAAIMYHAALQANIYRRAYLAVDFPDGDALSLGDALTGNGGRAKADAYILSLPCETVDDWKEDERGNLEWVRLHLVELVRTGAEQAEIERHTWCFFTADGRTDYEAEKKINEAWPEKAEAAQAGFVGYDYGGRLPIVRVEIPAGACSMTLMAPLLLEYFNNSAALQFLYDANCFQMLALFVDGEVQSPFMSELMAFKFKPGDSASYLSPSGTPYEQLRIQRDKNKEDIYQAVGNAVELSAAKEGFGRQTGAAVENKQVAFSLNLNTYRAFLKDALEQCLSIIKKIRKEEKLDIKVSGLSLKDAESVKDAPPLEINGAVAQGLIALMQSGVVTMAEARRRLGFSDQADEKEKLETKEAAQEFLSQSGGAPSRADAAPVIVRSGSNRPPARVSARPAQTVTR